MVSANVRQNKTVAGYGKPIILDRVLAIATGEKVGVVSAIRIPDDIVAFATDISIALVANPARKRIISGRASENSRLVDSPGSLLLQKIAIPGSTIRKSHFFYLARPEAPAVPPHEGDSVRGAADRQLQVTSKAFEFHISCRDTWLERNDIELALA